MSRFSTNGSKYSGGPFNFHLNNSFGHEQQHHPQDVYSVLYLVEQLFQGQHLATRNQTYKNILAYNYAGLCFAKCFQLQFQISGVAKSGEILR